MKITRVFVLTLSLSALLVACAAPATDQRQSVELLVMGDYVVTMNDEAELIRNGAVAIDGGHIIAVGRAADLSDRYRGKTTLRGEQRIVMPGLINGHTHAAMTLLRGIADDLPLMKWLEEYIFPAELTFVDKDFVRVGTELAAWEMIRGGTTSFVDMYYFPDAVAEAVVRSGLRAIVAPTVIDQTAPDASNGQQSLAQAEDFARRWKSRNSRVVPSIGGHAIYTLPTTQLENIRDAADAIDVPVAMHIAETEAEHAFATATFGQSPIAYLDGLDFFRNKVIGAHVVHPSAADMAILADKRVGAIHNPTSNMKLASGASPVVGMRDAGVTVGLGTDGTASNNDLDMWEEIRLASLLAKVTTGDPEALSAYTALSMATRDGAAAIGLGEVTGQLKPGLSADLIQIDIGRLATKPLYDPVSHLVYVADQADVLTTIVEGQILMLDREVLTLDEKTLRTDVERITEAIRAELK